MGSRYFTEAIESVADKAVQIAHAERAETAYEGRSTTPDGQLHRVTVTLYGGFRGDRAASDAAAGIKAELRSDPTVNGRIRGVITTLVGSVEENAAGETTVVVQVSGYV